MENQFNRRLVCPKKTDAEQKLLFLFSPGQLGQLLKSVYNDIIVVRIVGERAGGAIFDSVGVVGILTSAPRPQSIKGAVTKQAVKSLGIGTRVTGEIGAVPIGKKTERIFQFHAVPPDEPDGLARSCSASA